jgi:hypothetical protein
MFRGNDCPAETDLEDRDGRGGVPECRDTAKEAIMGEEALTMINANIYSANVQVAEGGALRYPPKLKLLCVPGTDVVKATVEKVFVASYSVTVQLVLDDEEYRSFHLQIAGLLGTKVSDMTVSRIAKMHVQLKWHRPSTRKFALRDGVEQATRSRLKRKSKPREDSLTALERELLGQCYLTTTTFRDVRVAQVPLTILCPTRGSLEALKCSFHRLSFSIELTFSEPVKQELTVPSKSLSHRQEDSNTYGHHPRI